jgi:glycosyltransferase involved in cell wall biosynthesis
MAAGAQPLRLAFVVSHPIQYYVPLYQRLARRPGVEIRVFYTWHAGEAAVRDHGFRQPIAWDIPLTEGYEYELVPNTSSDPGTHRFLGLRNPDLARHVRAWRPDAVHVTGWAWYSHLMLLRDLHGAGIPTLFRGDSHLLDGRAPGPVAGARAALRRHVFRWPAAFLYVGEANRRYYEAHGVEAGRLCRCPHSIDVERFAVPAAGHAAEARRQRAQLGIPEPRVVLLYAGKFEPRKQPLELMRAVRRLADRRYLLIMAGAGELEADVRALAASDPDRFRVLPFRNQSEMPATYRLGDIFVLPSAFGETWGLAVNEAMACGRPVIVSDRVGCAEDVVDESCGRVFPWNDFDAFATALATMSADRATLERMGEAAARRARAFDIPVTEEALVACARGVVEP